MAMRGRPRRRTRRAGGAPLLQMPPEICAKICEDLERADLIRLCRISLFRDQAQRLMYRTVDLRRCSPKTFKSWCLAVTRHSQLAERVHTLSLSLPDDLSLSSDTPKVARALGKCLNLKELCIYSESPNILYPNPRAIQGWIINKCPFRLTKFANSYFKNSFISHQFWNAQSEMQVLSIPSYTDSFPCFEDQLPNLIALEVGSAPALPPDRELQRIQLRLTRSTFHLAELSALSRYSPTLTTLNILQSDVVNSQQISTRDVFQIVAREVPSLLHFGITELANEMYAPDSFIIEDSPVNALAKFTQLETFIFHSRTILGFNDFMLHRTHKFENQDGLKAFGMTIMDACPALRRAIVGARIYAPRHHLYLPESSESVWTLTRPAGGEIQSEYGTKLDFMGRSMFWTPY
ncbi:hypothetical protein FB451DRAFT_1259650 [Mycena latifolia]|nr:hypothetical protein FB451DRAFT_1259650 [Mycena latifolia]